MFLISVLKVQFNREQLEEPISLTNLQFRIRNLAHTRGKRARGDHESKLSLKFLDKRDATIPKYQLRRVLKMYPLS